MMILSCVGCEIMPMKRLKPVLKNPFPSIETVAVVPFVNKSNNPNLDGSMFARAYASELQKIDGFDALPVRTVEERMKAAGITSLSNAEDARLLCRILGVDAVVLGRINDYQGYRPFQLNITVEWYAANQYIHPVPAGYGLPWGTTREEEIPYPLMSAAEREIAKAQLKTQIPDDPEGEAKYEEFLERKMQERLREQQEKGLIQAPRPLQSEENPLDPDDPDYEEFDPAEQEYQKLQRNSINEQFIYAHGGPARIPKPTHHREFNLRNAETMKKEIAAALGEEIRAEVGEPLQSPLPEGLEPSEWTDRFHHVEILENSMHRTQKPELPPRNVITTEDSDQESANLPALLARENPQQSSHSQNPQTQAPSSHFPRNSAPAYPSPYGFHQFGVPQNAATPPVAAYGAANYANFGYPGGNPTTSMMIAGNPYMGHPQNNFGPSTYPGYGGTGNPGGFGYLVQGPADPETGKVLHGIYITLEPDGNPAAAYRVDMETGTLQSDIPLEELGLQPSALHGSVPVMGNYHAEMPGMLSPEGRTVPEPKNFPGLPEDWPDARGLIPDGPSPVKPKGTVASNAPTFSLTKHYSANDSELTEALADFDFNFRDDQRIGGWQMTLNDPKTFITFCCRMHIWEMFSARGGADKAVEVRRTWKTWYGGQNPYR